MNDDRGHQITNKTDKRMQAIAGSIHELMDTFNLDEVKLDVRLQADSESKDVHMDERIAHMHLHDHGGVITVSAETPDSELPVMIAAPLLDLVLQQVTESAYQIVKGMRDRIDDDMDQLIDDITSQLLNGSTERGEHDA